MRVRLLGPVDVVKDGEPRVVSGARRKAVLATLALHDREVVSVGRLVDVVWGEAAPPNATNSLQAHVSYLRGVLENRAAIRAHPPGYVYDLGAESTDVQVAERLLRQGTQSADPARAVRQLAAALALWRGEALADLTDLAGLEDQARRLGSLCLQVKRALADARLAAGEHLQLVPSLEEMAAEHPLDERIHAQLMQALYRSGRQGDALAVYRRLRQTLGEQLGIDPSQLLRDLETAILQQDPSLDAPMAADTPTGVLTLSQTPVPVTSVPVTPVPAQLPSAVAAFAGRGAELDSLAAILPAKTRAPVAAISGPPGVGKTALAVCWAHRVAERFPDGQLYVDLRGFDPARAPLDPGEVLRGFLDALGVHAHRIPRGFDAQLGLFRSVLATKRVLVLLDNARDADQVRPLLPGSSGCMTVVTSRTQLTPLVAMHGALPLTLELLTPEQSRDLLERRLGASRVAAEQAAAEQVIARCAGLPLALAIVAAHAEVTATPLSVLAGQLQDFDGMLDSLTAGDGSTDLRAVFSWSTSALTPQAAVLYRLLGLHPGPDLTVAAAASIAGKPLERTRLGLGELVRASLLTEHLPGRFTSHDLLRAYAAEQARSRCTGQDQHAAVLRMLDHYLHSAQEAARLLYGPWNHVSLPSAQDGVTAERFADEQQAIAWLQAEYQVLLSSIEFAANAGFGTYAWQLAFSIGTYFEMSGHWRDWTHAARVALTAAEHTGDTSGQAHAHQQLGYALAHLEDYDQAHSHLRTAIDLFGSLGDDVQRALVHLGFGYLYDCQHADEKALDHAQHAIKLYRSTGHHAGEAVALSNIGWSQAQRGRYADALLHCRRALGLFQQAADRQGQAAVWDTLGYIHHSRAEHAEAIACCTKAAGFFAQIRDSYNEAVTLTRLGDAYHAAGDRGSAHRTWQQALLRYKAVDHPDITDLRRRLAGSLSGAAISS